MPDDFTSVLKEKRVFKPSKEFSSKAHIKSMGQYQKIYKSSVKNPEKFWAEKARNLNWFKKWKTVLRNDNGHFKWFEGGKINVCYNCIDKNIEEGKGNKTAIIWEAEDGQTIKYTYSQLLYEVSRFANVLKSHGLRKEDRVCIYLPMIPELAVAMLACARIGLIHSIVFGGFSSESLKDRILDCEAKMVITSDGSFRNGKILPLKQNADKALMNCHSVKKVIVVQRCKNKITMKKGKDLWWHKEMSNTKIKDNCIPAKMDSEDTLFILYTSGTTGKPKGVLHTQAGYLLYVNLTFKWIFDIKDNDIYWCTADIGWITGHSYIIYGPLSNGATSLMYEGSPIYPNPDRFWEIVEKYKVTIFYTAPTAIRALMKYGNKWPKSRNLKSVRLLGTVGESINPEAWIWYYNVIGNKKCPIVDTWWQTETGGILITPLPGATPLKPGSATLPFPGIVPEVLRENGSKTNADEGGYLVIKKPWPGMLRTVWRNPKRYKKTYFSKFQGIYLTGDSARIDKDGYLWIMGRTDDVIKVAGHRLGTAEVESHIVSHKSVAESAIVPIPDTIKGQAIYAFVTLKKGIKPTDELKKDIIAHVANNMSHIAKPSKLQFAEDLPKTRSGKIMRRILKAIAEGSKDIGSTTTLADPSVVEKLQKERTK
jgi:acetyl-CoA synthetase|tara:strand:+ start:2395 stop:4350 length:1956 start_codon:yes stop_codon:yes gene_type:complete